MNSTPSTPSPSPLPPEPPLGSSAESPGQSAPPVTDLTDDEKAFVREISALSVQGLLLKRGTASVRMFSINGEKTVTAFLIQESSDGFIVALPVVLSSDPKTKSVSGTFISPVPMLKMYKNSSVAMMAMPTPLICFHYLGVAKQRFDSLPGYFNRERVTQLEMLRTQLGTQLEPKGEEKTRPKSPTPVRKKNLQEKPSSEENVSSEKTPVSTDESLRFYITPTTRYKH